MKTRTLHLIPFVSALALAASPTQLTSAQQVVTLQFEYLWDVEQPEEWQALSGGLGSLAWGEPGQFFIADPRNARVLLVDTDGHLIQEIGRLGEGPGEFREPRAIAYDCSTHTLWAADWMLARGSRFARRQGRYEFENSVRIGSVTNAPAPVFAVDDDGDLWLMNSVRGTGQEYRIRDLDSDGRLIRGIAPAQEAPEPWWANIWNRGAVLALSGDRIAYVWRSQPRVEIWQNDGQLILDRLLGGPTFDMPPAAEQPSGQVLYPQSFSTVVYDRASDAIFVSGRMQNQKGPLWVALDADNLEEVGRYYLPVPEEVERGPLVWYLLVEWVNGSIRFMGLDIRTHCLVRLTPVEP